MRQLLSFRTGLLLSTLLPLLLFIGLQVTPHFDHLVLAPLGHFQVVTAISLLATVVAGVVGVSGRELARVAHAG